MKIRSLILVICALALASSTFFQPANAAPVPLPVDGDLYMGFRSTTATNEYLWNIGQYTQFDGKSPGFHLLLGNIQTDLTTVFGANWATDINVQWGSAGTLDATSQVFASKAELVVGEFAIPWTRQSTSSQNFTGSQIDTLAFGGFAGQEASPNNPRAVIHSATSGLTWASFNNGANSPGGSFGTWVPTIEAPQTPGSGNGIASSRLDLFRIDPDNGGTNPPSEYMGSLSVDAIGNVSFDVFAEGTPTPTPTPTISPTPTVSPTPTPTISPTPTVSPTPTPTISPTPTVSPTPTPSPTPLDGSLANISTRLNVGTGDNVLIGGFIITENTASKATAAPKNVIIRAIGPSLPVAGALADPVLTLYDVTGTAIATNDDWRTNANFQEIIDSTVPPPNDKEAALLLPLQPAAYTAIVSGAGGTTGVGLVEVYDLDGDATSKLANISTRGFVQTGDDVMIAGVIVTGSSAANVLFRAIGPTLPLANALLDPTLEIYNGSGMLMFTNDNWKVDENGQSQQAEIEATGLAPLNDKESAILTTLSPGPYTAIVRGVNGTTGNGLVEAYRLNQ